MYGIKWVCFGGQVSGFLLHNLGIDFRLNWTNYNASLYTLLCKITFWNREDEACDNDLFGHYV